MALVINLPIPLLMAGISAKVGGTSSTLAYREMVISFGVADATRSEKGGSSFEFMEKTKGSF